jgi:D-alanyl-D-alanine carboxypeptidase (penicillin-binding protein 5/6)
MRLIAGLIASAVCAASLFAAAQTPAASPPSSAAAAEQFAADPLNTLAPYAVILDGDSGEILYSKLGDEPMIPASMSKLMLYYLIFERIRDGRLKLEDEFTVSEHAWRTGGAGTDGSTMFLKLGSKVSVENLLKGAVIQSGNDACIALAEGAAGSEEAFAREMTARAAELGLTHSTFTNATGLDDPGHRMSAADIARISFLIIRDFPQFYPMFRETSFTWNGITQPNRNPLLREVPGADGVKTGHLSSSGFGLAGSAVREGKRRIVVLQGLSSESERRIEGPRVMRAAFADFQTYQFVRKDVEVAVADVWLGQAPSVPLIATQDVSAGLHVAAAKKMRAEVVYKGPLYAPVRKGDVVGELIVTAPGMKEIRVPVSAGADVPKLGLFGRAMRGLRGE